MQKTGKIAVSPRLQQDNDNPHMKDTPQLSLQSFSLFNKIRSVHSDNGKPFSPALTSLEEEAVPGYIQFTGHLAQGGRNYSWNQVKSTDGESINA